MQHLIGKFADMTNADYHAHPAVGSSGIKELQRSPLHYWAKYLNPARDAKEPTPAMKIGTAWHAAIFEPEKFMADYVVIPAGLDRRTKEGKALWQELVDSGREPLSADEYERIAVMRANAADHPVTRIVFGQDGGAAEVSFFWIDPATGVNCKIRPDYYVPPCDMFPHGLIVDGKTGEDMSADGFAKYAWNWDCHIQAAFYCDGFKHVHGTSAPPAFMWLAQEKEAPYATAYYAAAADFIEFGRQKYRRLLGLLGDCAANDNWPGYPQTVQALELPAWAAKQVQEGVAA